MTESVEEFLARGGQVEKVEQPPRVEKMTVPFGGVAPVRYREYNQNTDGLQWGHFKRKR